MTKPKNMTPELEAARKAEVAAAMRRYREAHPERVVEARRRFKEAHPEKVAEWARRRREANPALFSEYRRRWAEANPEKTAEIRRRQQAELPPHIVAGRLGVPVAELTPELYTMKREQILNSRALRELKAVLKEITK